MSTVSPPRPDDDDRGHGHGADNTQAVQTDDHTRVLQTSPTQGYDVSRDTREGAATAYPTQPEPVRPNGISWATVILGLVALLVGGVVLGIQLVDVNVDWSVATPAVFVGAGAVLVLLGLVALAQRRSKDESV